jgi:putative redox protein
MGTAIRNDVSGRLHRAGDPPTQEGRAVVARVERITFRGSQGVDLAARLDLPAAPPSAYALFAHCFTCTKEGIAASRIATELTDLGFGVLRFDFTGLGGSDGEFANTNFSSNTEDLRLAAGWLRDHHHAPQLLIGHSFGGAAVLAVAGALPEVRAVVTIAAPSDLDQVAHLFTRDLARIEAEGEAEVVLAGRSFSIRTQFLDDLHAHDLAEQVATMGRPLLILHSPQDEIVGIEHAERLLATAREPKSRVSLDRADHLLTDRSDAAYAARVIAAWAGRFLEDESGQVAAPKPRGQVVVAETTQGAFLNHVVAGEHRFLADEPVSAGGFDAGPSPYDLLAAALGACTSMTVRSFAERRGIALDRVTVDVDHGRVHAHDCEACIEGHAAMIDTFECRIQLDGGIGRADRARLMAIANRCPVHRTLAASSTIVTTELTPTASVPSGSEPSTGRRAS